MTVSSLKRPRVDELLLRDHSLSTIHPAKKLFMGTDSVSKAAKLSKDVFYTDATAAGTGAFVSGKPKAPFSDRTNLQRLAGGEEKLRGFKHNGLLSLLGASNAVTQKLFSVKHPEKDQQTLANDLAASQQGVLDTIRKVSFLTKEQKLCLMKQISERKNPALYGVELKQYAKICQYLDSEQEKYLLRLRESQRG